jgi:hypothetical protein
LEPSTKHWTNLSKELQLYSLDYKSLKETVKKDEEDGKHADMEEFLQTMMGNEDIIFVCLCIKKAMVSQQHV